jgi:hypothetical protein
MTLSVSAPAAYRGDKSASPWVYFNVNVDKSVEVFGDPTTRPPLPEHKYSSPSVAPKALSSRKQALADLEKVWSASGPFLDPKGAVDCWMALFHPPSDAIAPERGVSSPTTVGATAVKEALGQVAARAAMATTAVAVPAAEEPTLMLNTLPPVCEPLPGTLPTRAVAKPEEYYLDLPRVSNMIEAM